MSIFNPASYIIGGKSSLVKLWENSDTTASFAATTITPSVSGVSFADYDYFIITSKHSTSIDQQRNDFVCKGIQQCVYVRRRSNANYQYRYHRIVTPTDNGLVISGGYTNKANDNTLCIPVAIYGFKF